MAFLDNFTDTDGTSLVLHTSDSGHTYTNVVGGAVISDANRLRGSSGIPVYYASYVPPTADYEVTGVFKSIDGTGEFGIAIRMATGSETYYLVRWNAGNWQLFRAIAGSFTQLGSDFADAMSAGDSTTVKLKAVGTGASVAVTVNVSGSDVITVSDTDADRITSAGRVGFRGTASNNTDGLHLDSLAADVVSGSGIAVTPSTVPAEHAGNIVLALVGTGTSWDGTTVFTPSGVANVTKITQNVTDATHATLTITTGAGTGTLTITETVTGSNTGTVAVAAASMLVSPSSIADSSSGIDLTLTGTNTLWDDDTATFTLSGAASAGSSITATVINSNTSVTLTVTTGSTAGTLTIEDDTISGNADSTTVAGIASQIVFDGNSMTFGVGATAGQEYPTQTAALLGSSWTSTNYGVSSQTTQDMIDDAATEIDPDRLSAKSPTLIVVWEGTNDIYFGATDIEAYDRLVAYCQDRQAADWQVIIVTLLPRDGFSEPANQEVYRLSVNDMLRENWQSFADGIADVARDSRIGDLADVSDTTYYDDQTHLTDAGYGIIANYVAAEALRIQSPGGAPAGGTAGGARRRPW